jgi:hypothetical protein
LFFSIKQWLDESIQAWPQGFNAWCDYVAAHFLIKPLQRPLLKVPVLKERAIMEVDDKA